MKFLNFTQTDKKWGSIILTIKNKLGGQYKVPRLQNDRNLIEEIMMLTS
jgi:hypothetical protein